VSRNGFLRIGNGNALFPEIIQGFTQVLMLTVLPEMPEMGRQDPGPFGRDLGHHPPFIVGRRLPFFHGDGAKGTVTDTRSQAVASRFAHQPGLPVNQLKGPLGTTDDAVTATGAFLFVYFYDLAFHVCLLVEMFLFDSVMT
jgi:hypothetical protein